MGILTENLVSLGISVDILWESLKSSAKWEISGNIYKFSKDENSCPENFEKLHL